MTEPLQAGRWASILVQYLEDRGGRALVRLPNGSKTSISHDSLHSMIVSYLTREDVDAGEIAPGDIYEDCSYHPVLCTSRDGDEVKGISLIDGSRPRACSLKHCGVAKLEIADVAEVVDRSGKSRHSSSINGEVIGHGRNLFNHGGRMHTRADDFLDAENWHGSHYELAVMLGAPTDLDADVRLQHARTAVWRDERLDGCYLDRRRSPERELRADPDLTGVELIAPVYGRARLPGGVTVVCASYVIREEGQDAADWLDLCLPTGALERVIPQLDYPLHKDGSRVWREPIDAWLVGVAERVSSSTGFLAALIGEEVSGLPALGPAGEPIPDVQARTSVLTRTEDGVKWHRPLNW